MSDFNYRILDATAHRPWPMPSSPWVMTQTWHQLLFAHWPVDVAILRERVPAGLPLDVYEGQAWLGIVPFHMTNVAPRGVPSLPFVSAFPELNVRTYVTLEGKPGVYFFSLDADSAVAVAAARTLFGLPYFRAEMKIDIAGDEVRYTSTRETHTKDVAKFEARYRPVGPAQSPREGTLEYFLTERYCLYRVDAAGHAQRLEIHHPQWALQAAEATIAVNTMAAAAGIPLPPIAPRLHYAERQDAVAWRPYRIVNTES